MDATERRRHRRVNWRGSVRLVVDGVEPVTADIADISEFGCGLQAERAVAVGIDIGIHGDAFQGEGIVRYCYPHRGGYRLGIELKPA